MRWLPPTLLGAIAAAAFTAIALATALGAVRGLAWPPDPDHYRDVSQAQVTLDGRPFDDPFYRGERLWYNPLIPWSVAAGAKAFRVEPERAHVQGGPWVNLVAPAGVYTLGAIVFGPLEGIAATVAYLFLTCGSEPGWSCATYSPWLFPLHPAQGLFSVTLAVLITAARRDSRRWYFASGALAGATFLAHTAPALILGAVATVVSLIPRRPQFAERLAMLGTGALLVASPYLFVVGWRYQFHVVNPVPLDWEYWRLTPAEFPGLLRTYAGLVPAVAIVGIVAVARAGGVQARSLLTWIALAAALTLFGVLRPLTPLGGFRLPVPTFHFWLYTTFAVSIFFGAGYGVIVKRVPSAVRAWIAIVILVGLVYRAWPDYLQREEFRVLPHVARNQHPDLHAARRFLRGANRNEVFLATHGAGQMILGPAGLKTVAVQHFFSNPFVPYGPRAVDRDRMFDLLKRGDLEPFYTLARKYDVTGVVGVGASECKALKAGGGAALRVLWEFSEVCLLRLEDARDVGIQNPRNP